MLRTIVLSAGATALLLATPVPTPAFAHHPSGAGSTGGAGPIVTIPATTLEQGDSSAAVVFEYLKLNPLSDAQLGSMHPHPHSLDAIFAPSLVYAYGVTDDLTFSLRLPFVRRANIRDAHAPPDHQPGPIGDSAGLGDLSVLGQYRFLNDKATRTEVALLAGLTLPTGDTTSVDSTAGERFETEFQPGSGAWAGSFGLALTRRFRVWSFDTNVLYVLGSEGAQATDLGDRVQYNAALSYRLSGGLPGAQGPMRAGALPEPMYHGGPRNHSHKPAPEAPAHAHGPALDLVLEVNGEWHDRQRVDGVSDPNSGGNVVFLSPGLRVSYERWSGFVSVGVPVVNDLNGLQAEPEWRLLTGAAVNF